MAAGEAGSGRTDLFHRMTDIDEFEHLNQALDINNLVSSEQILNKLADTVATLCMGLQEVDKIDKEQLITLAACIVRKQDELDNMKNEIESLKLNLKSSSSLREEAQLMGQHIKLVEAENQKLYSMLQLQNERLEIAQQKLQELRTGRMAEAAAAARQPPLETETAANAALAVPATPSGDPRVVFTEPRPESPFPRDLPDAAIRQWRPQQPRHEPLPPERYELPSVRDLPPARSLQPPQQEQRRQPSPVPLPRTRVSLNQRQSPPPQPLSPRVTTLHTATTQTERRAGQPPLHSSYGYAHPQPRRKEKHRPKPLPGNTPSSSDEETEEIHGRMRPFSVRPVFKSETVYGKRGKGTTTARTRPYTALQVREFREMYSRMPHETITDYVYRVVESGAHSVILSREEVGRSCWGPAVFLGNGPEGDVALSSRIFYWASSFDPVDRDEPTKFRITTCAELDEAVTKLACVQAMYEGGIYPNPMDAPIDPRRLRPLVKGLSGTLRSICDTRKEQIEELIQFGVTTGYNLTYYMTWGDLLEELSIKGHNLGYYEPVSPPASFFEKQQPGNKGSYVVTPRGKKQDVRHAKASQSAYSGSPESPKGSPRRSPRASPRSSPRGSPELNRRYSSRMSWGQSPYFGQDAYQRQNTKYGVKPRDLLKRNRARDPMKAELFGIMGGLEKRMQDIVAKAMKHLLEERETGGNHGRSSRAASPNRPDQSFTSDQQGAKSKQKN
ncbi:uncharacterized protein LOC135184107 [Pogoniulus pusillus]|uniref:uncharacterized protein LOC135184107 n=1 Tax=Pogoniulus pusillus TaxID=488313 RepID=UPI0030B92A52